MDYLFDIDWTDEQKEFLDLNKNGKFVVKACPGSGKTTAVTERLYQFIKNWNHKKSGIAVLSFTNVAADEIKENFDKNKENLKIEYPHFIGTLDSFINQYIFLPYGRLVMGCEGNPMLVGEPFNYWTSDNPTEQYFDKITFKTNGKIDFLNLSPDEKLEKMKYKLTKKGYSTQKDAIYHAKNVLEQFPKITKALSARFPYIIIDESQDTTEMHMKIIDLLIDNGLENIILVGDPEQALYQWNNAKPKLFNDKYKKWEKNSLTFKTNFRSSQKICDFFSKISKIDSIKSECQHDMNLNPKIIPYYNKHYNILINNFITYCKSKGIPINPNNICVLFRGRSEINKLKKTFNKNKILDIFKEYDRKYKSFTVNILEGLYQWHNNECLEGFKKIEKEFIKQKNNLTYVYPSDINYEINNQGFQNHRLTIYKFIKQFPPIKNNDNITKWINYVNSMNNFIKLCEINKEYSDLTFELLFKGKQKTSDLNYNLGTVHSVKGDSFEAVLLILKNKANYKDYYEDLINEECYLCEEELRIIYVALSRPKKILHIAVPDNDYNLWTNIFYEQ